MNLFNSMRAWYAQQAGVLLPSLVPIPPEGHHQDGVSPKKFHCQDFRAQRDELPWPSQITDILVYTHSKDAESDTLWKIWKIWKGINLNDVKSLEFHFNTRLGSQCRRTWKQPGLHTWTPSSSTILLFRSNPLQHHPWRYQTEKKDAASFKRYLDTHAGPAPDYSDIFYQHIWT